MASWALLGHIFSAFVLFAGMVTAAAGWEVGRRTSRPAAMAQVLRLCRIGALAVAAGTLATLAFGLWLVELQGRSVGDVWLTWALVLLVIAAVAGFLGGQRPKRARKLAQEAAERGHETLTPELVSLLGDRASAVLNYVAAACILVIIYLMVFKPS